MQPNELELLDFLSQYSIEFGILDSDGETWQEVNILDIDNNQLVELIRIKDIMYFTEYGTISIPGKFILEKCLPYINRLLEKEIDKTIDEIFKGDKTKEFIRTRMNEICLKIQNYVRNYMRSYVKHNNRLGTIIHSDTDENKYVYNLSKLSNYLRCVPKFEN